ncbi:MAG: SDR family oxidoreductase [Rhodoferax sp.]|uniref:UDP-glucose 4-epimerase family protein n=1 Tax=Rhodoferax sp. TaxID=50421 RepID=UPI001B6BF347|nr:SDR family oxidoreductase [Rhodoferax sp.]MBP9904742.1 SDR family oxidoreductase [Rhodoferax sp.]
MRVLVTGANGLVGRRLCGHLTALGVAVRAVVRDGGASKLSGDCVRVGDLGASTSWHEALSGVDTIVHLAARVHVMNDDAADPLAAFRQVNVAATLNLARQAVSAGVRRLVFVSTVKVNGEHTAPGQVFAEHDIPAPQDPYAISKWEAEQGLWAIVRDTGLELVIVRPPLVYGPGVRANFAALVRWVQRGWPLPLAAVHNARSLVALDNLVDFLSICLSHPAAANQLFLVSDGEDKSTADLVRGIAHALRRPSRLVALPVWALQLAGRLTGRTHVIDRLCANLQLDIHKARQRLQWEPRITVAEGLRRTISIEAPT